jgi:hypothetical protein
VNSAKVILPARIGNKSLINAWGAFFMITWLAWTLVGLIVFLAIWRAYNIWRTEQWLKKKGLHPDDNAED